MSRTPAQIGAANRTRGKDTERKVAAYLHAAGLGDGRRNLAGYARDHGDYGPVVDSEGELWAIEIKGPTSQPTPGEVEAWAVEAQREAENSGAPQWVLIVRRPQCADVGRWFVYMPFWMLAETVLWFFSSKPQAVTGESLACIDLRTWSALVAPERQQEAS